MFFNLPKHTVVNIVISTIQQMSCPLRIMGAFCTGKTYRIDQICTMIKDLTPCDKSVMVVASVGRAEHTLEGCTVHRLFDINADDYCKMVGCLHLGSGLGNFLVSHKIMNGSVGIVREIVYSNKDGPDGFKLPDFFIVEFRDCTIPEDEKKPSLVLLFHENILTASSNYSYTCFRFWIWSKNIRAIVLFLRYQGVLSTPSDIYKFTSSSKRN